MDVPMVRCPWASSTESDDKHPIHFCCPTLRYQLIQDFFFILEPLENIFPKRLSCFQKLQKYNFAALSLGD
jgi:hypothetical protein